jgi:ubiquinone/menaquinone biosynthesis C-methylase UbiE
MAWDNVWESVFKESEWGKYPSEHLIRYVAKGFYKTKRAETKILEIGCGPGVNIWYLCREGFDTYGIDGSETAIKKAQEKLSKEGFKANLLVGDIMDLPYKDGTFDLVIDSECVYANDLTDSKKMLAEVKRVLNKGGRFYSRTFSEKMFIGDDYTEVGHMEYNNIKKGPLADKGFVRLIDKKGIDDLYGGFFRILSCDTLDYTIDSRASIISEYLIDCIKE